MRSLFFVSSLLLLLLLCGVCSAQTLLAPGLSFTKVSNGQWYLHAFQLLPGGTRALIMRRSGQLQRAVTNGALPYALTTILTLDTAVQEESGAIGLVLDPKSVGLRV